MLVTDVVASTLLLSAFETLRTQCASVFMTYKFPTVACVDGCPSSTRLGAVVRLQEALLADWMKCLRATGAVDLEQTIELETFGTVCLVSCTRVLRNRRPCPRHLGPCWHDLLVMGFLFRSF